MTDQQDKRNHYVKSDYGVNDYYRAFCKENKDVKVSRLEYGQIIRSFNTHLRDRLATKGAGFILPCRMGIVELRKMKTEVKINEEGNVVNNLSTNWKATRDLWKSNPGSKEKGVKIKFTNEHTNGHTFRVSYLKGKATYKNKSIYKIRFNRTLKRTLSKSIFQGRIDAFLNPY